ncbi:MAG: hypothetical protein ACHQ4H_13145 [Ktedonobacterales bacterium]
MHGFAGWPARGRGARVVVTLFAALVALVVLGAVTSGSPRVAEAHALDSGTLTIVIPQPDSSGLAQGPVGTNLTISASGLTAGDSYQLGYASTDSGCGNGFAQFDGGAVTATDGTFSLTVHWPATAANVGATYNVCAQDTAQPSVAPVQATQTFRVLSANAPAISLVDPVTSAPLPGPTYRIFSNAPLTISGQNFMPSGMTLVVYLSAKKVKVGGDFDSATNLGTTDSTPITTQDSGNVMATVQVPAATQAGTYYLYLVSNDRQGDLLPSLLAFTTVRVAAQPTPTASPSPTHTSKPSPTPGGSPSGGATSAGRILGIISLALISLILFITGTILLASNGRRP